MTRYHQTAIREPHNEGQSNTLSGLANLVDEFEITLRKLGIAIKVGSQLEAACLAVAALSDSHKNPSVRDPSRDTRQYYIDAFGIWTFMAKIIRLHSKPG
jgi:hypothetical protein